MTPCNLPPSLARRPVAAADALELALELADLALELADLALELADLALELALEPRAAVQRSPWAPPPRPPPPPPYAVTVSWRILNAWPPELLASSTRATSMHSPEAPRSPNWCVAVDTAVSGPLVCMAALPLAAMCASMRCSSHAHPVGVRHCTLTMPIPCAATMYWSRT